MFSLPPDAHVAVSGCQPGPRAGSSRRLAADVAAEIHPLAKDSFPLLPAAPLPSGSGKSFILQMPLVRRLMHKTPSGLGLI